MNEKKIDAPSSYPRRDVRVDQRAIRMRLKRRSRRSTRTERRASRARWTRARKLPSSIAGAPLERARGVELARGFEIARATRGQARVEDREASARRSTCDSPSRSESALRDGSPNDERVVRSGQRHAEHDARVPGALERLEASRRGGAVGRRRARKCALKRTSALGEAPAASRRRCGLPGVIDRVRPRRARVPEAPKSAAPTTPGQERVAPPI